METPPRWHDRLESLIRASAQLEEALQLERERSLSELEKAGVVKRFELAWELSWRLLADYLAAELTPPPHFTAVQTVREAARAGLLSDPDAWMAAGKLRNTLVHEYDEARRNEGLLQVRDRHARLIAGLVDEMTARRG